MSTPFVTSRGNGIKIPLLAGQAGMLHRFRTPENQLVMSDVTGDEHLAAAEGAFVSPGSVDPMTVQLKEQNAALSEMVEKQAAALAALQAQVQALAAPTEAEAQPTPAPVLDTQAPAGDAPVASPVVQAEKPRRTRKGQDDGPPVMPTTPVL